MTRMESSTQANTRRTAPAFSGALQLVSVLLLVWTNVAAAQEVIFQDGLESEAVINSFSAPTDPIVEDDSIMLSWTTESAASCTPSAGAGGWDQLSIGLPDGSAQITISTAGVHTFTLTCNGTVGDPKVANVEVTVEPRVAITSFGASPDLIVEGASTTLSWATENAVSCVPSGGTGGWDQSSIVLPDGNAQITISNAGTHTFTLTCQGTLGDPAVADASVTVGAAVVITDFSVLPELIAEDESTTLSWTTQNAVSCVPSGGTGGWDQLSIDLPDGNAPFEIAIAEIYTFTLTCQGLAGDEVSADAAVTVEVPSCDPPALEGTVQSWEEFWLLAFPKPVYDQRFAWVPRKGFFALEFNTGNVVDDGKMTTIETTVTDGVRLGTFSQCPGDFDVEPECLYIWGISGGLRWATNGRVGACQLEPNTTYYFNVTYTDGVKPSSTTCSKSPCVTNLNAENF